jgi:hypothetical protein
MVSILKSDITWFPESSDGIKFTIRANKTFKVKSKDFENYFTGINFDFKNHNKLCFSLVGKFKDTLTIQNDEMLENNYLDKESKMLVLSNTTNKDIFINETEPLVVYSLCKKNPTIDDIDTTIIPIPIQQLVEIPDKLPIKPTKPTPVKVIFETMKPTPIKPVEVVEPTPVVEVVEPFEIEPTSVVEQVEIEPTPVVEVVEVVEPVEIEPTPVVEAESVESSEEVPKKRKYIKRTKQ